MKFVDQVFYTNDVLFFQHFFDDSVVSQRKSLFVDLSEPSFVDQLAHSFSSQISISDVRFDSPQHIDSCFIQFHKYSIV